MMAMAPFAKLLSIAALAAPLGGLALGACTATVDPNRLTACTMEHAPVCGRLGNRLQTFSNSCLARADGFSVVHQGECRPAGPAPGPVACTMEEAPVCARRENRFRSFANACMARADGYSVVHQGNCR
jgi:hypothetical protein